MKTNEIHSFFYKNHQNSLANHKNVWYSLVLKIHPVDNPGGGGTICICFTDTYQIYGRKDPGEKFERKKKWFLSENSTGCLVLILVFGSY